MTALRVAIAATAAGTLVTLALLLRETAYTLVAFMFLAQPLLLVGFVLFAWTVAQELRRARLM